jgi:hypothetical protein
MEGAEHFDFFRQPDFVKDPFLKESYAVYTKETLAGDGTGKLCHIHRPLIIDSRGRRVWGELSVMGNELRITIPETWLSEAAYPVIVDPAIGTTTVGSQTVWEQEPGSWVPVSNEFGIPVNRFQANETIEGLCTAYFYAYSDEEPESSGRPVLYSDNNNTPETRLSVLENSIDLQVKSGKPAGWRSGTFECTGSIADGSHIWFGISTGCFWYARFDYGSKYYCGDNYGDPLPDTYPLYDANDYNNFKLSMYFTCVSAKNYTRTLAQGVKLADNRKRTASYKRGTAMNANGVTLLGPGLRYYRSQTSVIGVTGVLNRFRGFSRFITEQAEPTEVLRHCRDFFRAVLLTARPLTRGQRSLAARRGIAGHAGSRDGAARERGFIRTLAAAVATADYAGKVSALLRTIQEQAAAFGEAGHAGEYLRGLYAEAGSMAETKHEAEYYRAAADAAGSTAVSPRHVFMFIRLATPSLVRDYLLSRFLKSRDEIVLKSPVAKELELDSRIQ